MRSGARSSTWSALNAIGAVRVVALVLRADYRCTYCACHTLPGRRHIDHVVPRSEGGGDEATNLVLACADCNMGRVEGGIPAKAFRYGRTRRDVEREIARQTAIPVEPGTELYARAVVVAHGMYPAHFARKARARARWVERSAGAFFDGLAAEARGYAA